MTNLSQWCSSHVLVINQHHKLTALARRQLQPHFRTHRWHFPSPYESTNQQQPHFTTSSHLYSSQPSKVNLHQKSDRLCAIFESQVPTESPAFTSVVTAFKTSPESADFEENGQKIEKLTNFQPKPPDTTRFGTLTTIGIREMMVGPQ